MPDLKATVFKNAEGRNVFCSLYFLTCLYGSSSSVFQFIFLFPTLEFYVFLESIRWKIVLRECFAHCCLLNFLQLLICLFLA